jgi:GntR family transcriptional regulator / MocR family aminotransferase
MLIKLDGIGPLSMQLYRALRGGILRGELAPGARLPSTRALAADAGVSRNTALLAYDQLLAEGYIDGRRGSGTYVTTELPEAQTAVRSAPRRPYAAASAPPHLSRVGERLAARNLTWAPLPARVPVDFRYGRPAFDEFPHDTWRRLLLRRWRRASERDLDYGPATGLPALREAIADYLRRARAVDAAAEQVVVVNGSQQGLDLCARLLLDAGARVVIEEPHYPGARAVFLAAGVRLLPAAVGADGLDVARLGAAASRARLAYVTPSHQFPTGALMSLARRLALLGWAERGDAYVIEDDYDSEYRYAGRPVESLQGLDQRGRVIYLGTFSKLLFPALRLGYLVVPPPLARVFANAKAMTDTGSATLEQGTLADFIRDGHFERHVRRARARNAARRAVLLDAIATHLGTRVDVRAADAGIHLLLRLPGVSAARLKACIARAEQRGVRVYREAICYLDPPPAAGLLLGYGGLAEAQIRDGIRQLALALEETAVPRRAR